MKEKVLITGASGFVGYHLINEALQKNLEVYAAVRKSSVVNHLKGLDIHLVEIDFQDVNQLRSRFEKDQYDYVIHAAGLTRAMTLEEYNITNVTASMNLAKVALEFSIKKFVFLSSLAVLGPLKYQDPNELTEESSPHPVTNYGRSKWMAEKALKTITGLPLIILRPTAVYGPREKDLLIMFRTLNRGLEPYIGYQEQYLSFIYVKDLAAITIQTLFSSQTNQVYNLSDGKIYNRYALNQFVKQALKKKTIRFKVPLSIVKLIARFLEASQKKKAPVLNLEKVNELAAENWKCSILKAQKDLNYQPEYDLEKGIKETIQWYKNEKWL